MGEPQGRIAKRKQDTYVYIDVSNIRAACLKTLGFMIDFVRLLEYFRQKYPNLKEARYYEGIAKGDEKKQRVFDFLERKGYVVCPLERKIYNSVELEERNVECPKCGNRWLEKVVKEHKAMKSNVDVYLATELLLCANDATRPMHIILVSCDGDYAETISAAIARNENVFVSVLATPMVRELSRNTLSGRLCKLSARIPRYYLQNINNIRDRIS